MDEELIRPDDPIAHIAVGGNTLSRGLTLEGLIVSYFVRSATAYDTLLQMGRWFGYRFGYEDLPRLWMTDEMQAAFHDLATIEEEVRGDIKRYDDEGLTPIDFAVRIRKHPCLAITSRLKMQHAIPAGIDYSGFTRQTRVFRHRDAEWLTTNWDAGARLVDRLMTGGFAGTKKAPHHVFENVPVALVKQFLEEYECHDSQNDIQRDPIFKYLKVQNNRGRCERWTVAVVSLARPDQSRQHVRLGSHLEPLAPVNRAKLHDRLPDSVDLGTISTQANFTCDLPNPPAKRRSWRENHEPPLLLLYPIRKDSSPRSGRAKEQLDAVHDILGMALAFPKALTDTRYDYIQVDLQLPEMEIDEEELTNDEDDL